MSYVFPLSAEPVQLCLLARPYGTVITISVDEFSAWRWEHTLLRSHHLELEGGDASSETGYRSHFFHDPRLDLTEDQLVDFALAFAEERFQELHPKRQLEFF